MNACDFVVWTEMKKCLEEACSRASFARGWCKTHYNYHRYHGTLDRGIRANAPYGSGTITHDGYRRIYKPDHANSNSRGYVFEHRYLMAEKLGRPLHRDETVHHKNGDRLDNTLDNLELWSKWHPYGQRVDDLLAWAHAIIGRYEP